MKGLTPETRATAKQAHACCQYSNGERFVHVCWHLEDADKTLGQRDQLAIDCCSIKPEELGISIHDL